MADKKDTPKEAPKQDDYKESLQRLQAEFENFQKRTAKEMGTIKEYAAADLIKKILPVMDSFELALQNSDEPEQFKKGVEMIFAQLNTVLEDEGLRPIKAIGEALDPYKHEVLMKEAGKDGIVEELQKGYMFKSHVLRTSKVKVGEGDQNESKQE